jgi:hypothetical protein
MADQSSYAPSSASDRPRAAALGEIAARLGSVRAAIQARPRLTVALVMVGSTFLTWFPFLAAPDPLYRYWDGPHYAYLAKTLYDVPANHPFTPYDLKPAYYATHLPAYPLLIRLLVPLTLGRYLPAMLLATLLSSVVAAVLFHEVLVRFGWVASPLWTAVLFAFLPPRWVIYHSVGASEPLFLVFVFGAFLAYRAERSGLVVVAIAIASLTRIMGVLLMPAFMLAALLDRRRRQAMLLPLAGLAVLALFGWHYVLYGDFLAYFTRNLDASGHLARTPLAAFHSYAASGNTHDAELQFGLYALYGLGTLALYRHRLAFLCSAAFFTFNVFVFHFDLSRMFLPIAPFALLVGFDGVLRQPACRAVLPLLVWLDCVYAWRLIPTNLVAPPVFEALVRVLTS